MSYEGTCTYQSKKAQVNIARVLRIFTKPMTASQAAESLYMTHAAVCRYLSHINSKVQRVRIIGNVGRAPIYKTIEESAPHE